MEYIAIITVSLVAILESCYNAFKEQRHKLFHIILAAIGFLAMLFALADKYNGDIAHRQEVANSKRALDSIRIAQEATIKTLQDAKDSEANNFLSILKLFDTSKYNQISTLENLSNVVALQNRNIALQNANIEGVSNVLQLQDLSLKEITGGDSYCYFTFFPSFLNAYAYGKRYRWEIKRDISMEGKYPLSEIRIVLHERKPGDFGRSKPDTFYIPFINHENIRFKDVNPVPPRYVTKDEDYFYFEILIVQRNDVLVQRVIFKKIFEDNNPLRDFWKHAWRLYSSRRGGRPIDQHIDPGFPDSLINNFEPPLFAPQDDK